MRNISSVRDEPLKEKFTFVGVLSLVYFPRLNEGSPFFTATSNGAASGPVLQDTLALVSKREPKRSLNLFADTRFAARLEFVLVGIFIHIPQLIHNTF